jgi:hypothetical protein
MHEHMHTHILNMETVLSGNVDNIYIKVCMSQSVDQRKLILSYVFVVTREVYFV